MNADLRASLLVGAAAAGLSMLVGIVAGISFGPLLLRAILFGAAFGGLAWGAMTLLRSSVPELFEASAIPAQSDAAGQEDVDEEVPQVGGAVDIVLDEGGAEEVGFGAVVPEPGFVPAAMTHGEDVADAEPATELAESVDDEVPFVEVAESSASRSAVVPPRAPAGVEELDMLPDLDAFSGSFGSLDISPPTTGAGESVDVGGGDEYHTARSGAQGPASADPATLAMAVRTLLKRDQKG